MDQFPTLLILLADQQGPCMAPYTLLQLRLWEFPLTTARIGRCRYDEALLGGPKLLNDGAKKWEFYQIGVINSEDRAIVFYFCICLLVC